MSGTPQSRWGAALAGALAGLAGTWAMSQAQRGWTRAMGEGEPGSAGGKHDARDWQERHEGQNSNELAAQAIARAVIGRSLTPEELRFAAPACHYAFGAACAALYGATAGRSPRHPVAAGAAFGTAVWLAADEAAMPLLGLSGPTTNRPREMHAQSLFAHLVYGATTELARRALIPRRRDHGFTFERRSVIITGGSRGLGLVLARQLVEQRARVTLIARQDDELARAATDLRALDRGVELLTVRADVRKRSDVEYAVSRAIGRFGRVDVVINNAGVIQTGPFDHMTLADYENAMNTHFWAPLHTTLAALPHMRRQGGGRIVNISSIGGRISVPHMLPYSASKFALTGLSDGLRAELAHENILVTSVFPGLMRTGSPPNATFKGRHEQEYAWFATADSMPGISIAAERAARQILAATRRGEAELVITIPAKLAIIARTLAPETFARAMQATNALLPKPTGPEGDRPKPGRESESRVTRSLLTRPTYAAARRNNEL